MAKQLLNYSVDTAVAMQFPLTTTGALKFAEAFFGHLLIGEEGLLLAVHCARKVLALHRSRAANLGAKVDLPDFIIPVIYQITTKIQSSISSLQSIPRPPQEMIEKVQKIADHTQKHPEIDSFFGRNYDVMTLEWKLFNELGSNVLHLTGIRGTGKTLLALWLIKWWLSTNLIKSYSHWSCKSNCGQGDLVGFLRAINDQSRDDYPAKKDEIIKGCRECRTLVLIDNIDHLTNVRGSNSATTTAQDRLYLKDFIGRLSGGKSVVILISVSPEPWLNLDPKKVSSVFKD